MNIKKCKYCKEKHSEEELKLYDGYCIGCYSIIMDK